MTLDQAERKAGKISEALDSLINSLFEEIENLKGQLADAREETRCLQERVEELEAELAGEGIEAVAA